MKKLLLVDIDGTLVDTRGVGSGAMVQAFHDAFEIAPEAAPMIDFNGAVDHDIVRKHFPKVGIALTEENRNRFYAAYLANLQKVLPPLQGEPLSGALSWLKMLRDDYADQAFLSVLTGNIREGAEIKLKHVGLNHFFSGGAFGDDHYDRDALGPIALERSNALSKYHYVGADVVVIGDTPRDVSCGKAIGARTVAVATGNFNAEQLEQKKPDVVVCSLKELIDEPQHVFG